MEASIAAVKDVLGKVISSIVDFPAKVNITHSVGDDIIVFSVKCAKEDKGKVIGKEGRMAISLRNIVNALSAKYKQKMLLEIEK